MQRLLAKGECKHGSTGKNCGVMSRIRVIALVGAGAISSAAICSLYLAYTLEESTEDIPPVAIAKGEAGGSPPPNDIDGASAPPAPKGQHAYLVAFLANADPQVRTLAAWGLVSDEEAQHRQREVLEFVRHEPDPKVRLSLYRYLHGQRSIDTGILVEMIREEKDLLTWLAGCDLLADVVKSGASAETLQFFDTTIVPALKASAVEGEDLHLRIAAIIALQRAGTDQAVDALEEIVEISADKQVVQAASSAIQLASAGQ